MGALGWVKRLLATVRGRSTILAALVVAATLVVGSIVLLGLYRGQLISSLDQTLEQQVADRAALLDTGSDPESLVVIQEDEALVWIGTLVGSVEEAAVAVGGTLQPIDDPRPETIGQTTTVELLVDETHQGEVEPERERSEMRLASAATADGGLIVLAGSEIESVDKAVAELGRLFAFAIPPVIALVAALTWFTTGLALRPVESIRARAAGITGTNLGERVPVPDGDDEIRHLAETVNAMLERIESHEYSLRQFSADASHELKSPVANLRALVDTAEVDDPRWAPLRAQLAGESDRLRDLVDNLLFLASHEAGRPPDRVGTLSLDELLFAEAELVAATSTAAGDGDAVTVDLGGVEPAEVSGSVTDLTRLVRNLVDNATRHAESRIALAIEVTDGGPTLIVGDDGPGIDPADHERIFDRFTRLDEARARGEGGSGLGLAIVKQIVDSHGAEITVTRSPLGGAEFRVAFGIGVATPPGPRLRRSS